VSPLCSALLSLSPSIFFLPPLCLVFLLVFPPSFLFLLLLLGPSSGFYSQRMHALWQEHGNGRRALWW
jgi:hypothetical protein